MLDYIELFYNTWRWRGSNNGLPPIKHEQQQMKLIKSVYRIRVDSVVFIEVIANLHYFKFYYDIKVCT